MLSNATPRFTKSLTFVDVLPTLMSSPVADVTASVYAAVSRSRLSAATMPGNTTNLYDGLSLGMQQVVAATDPGRATRLVVLSDGDPTAGIKDFSALVAHAAEIKSRGITCTFLGFGPDYNEELLASMAKRAGGNYYYIPRPEMIPDVLLIELSKPERIVQPPSLQPFM